MSRIHHLILSVAAFGAMAAATAPSLAASEALPPWRCYNQAYLASDIEKARDKRALTTEKNLDVIHANAPIGADVSFTIGSLQYLCVR